jgi:hypothetical protein
MPIERQPDPPRVVVDGSESRATLYEVDLTAPPSREWRAAFLRPPPSPITGDRTMPRHLGGWLRRIDRWNAYANSIVDE